MTDKQMHFIAWLITTATDKCQTMEEVRALNAEIRKHSAELTEEDQGIAGAAKKVEAAPRKADEVSLW